MSPERWRQVKEIFCEASERDPALVSGFLDERCAGDEELRDEVETLLISAAKPGSLVVESPALAGAAAELVREPASGSKIGRVVGNYLITGRLASGGMGVVYTGKHATLPREVVLKCIHPAGGDGEYRAELQARFRREAHIQSQLNHPNIVRVYEFFVEPDDCFLVMEYVPGSSLRSLLERRGPLPPEEAARLAIQALTGLEHAHTLHYTDELGNPGTGVVHRDIKPGNLLIDDRGNLKVTDFGIAKIGGERDLTKSGSSVGTMDYMSPEQIQGLPVDTRSDLYSAGVTLYEMLTGRVPFPANAVRSDYELLKAHVETDPRPVQAVNPAIPPGLARAVMRSLERDPGARWQTAAEFREALEQSAAPASARHRHFPRRLAVAVVTLLFAVVVSLVLWRNWPGKAAVETATVAVLPFVDLSERKDHSYLSDGVAEEILNALAQVPGLRVAGKTSSFQIRKSAGDVRAIGKALQVAAVLEGSVRPEGNRARISVQLIKTSDGIQLWSETYEGDLGDVFAIEQTVADTVASAIKGTLLGVRRSSTARRTNADAHKAYLQGRYLQAQANKESLEKAATYFEQAIQSDASYAQAWAGLADCRSAQAGLGYLDDGYASARAAAQRALALDPELADAYSLIAEIQMLHDWDWDGADASYRRALTLKPGDPNVLRGAASLARIMGRLEEAIRLFTRAIDIDPLLGHRGLGLILYYAGRYEQAGAAFVKHLELRPHSELTHGFIAQVYLAQSRPRDALEEAKQEKHLGFRLANLAMTYHALGRRKDSDAALSELIAKAANDSLAQIAQVYAFRGQADRAFSWLDRTYAARDPGMTELKSDPILKRLQTDPRYTAMLRKLRLPLE